MATYEFKCPDDVIECQDKGRCWGYFKKHTYKPFSELIGKDTLKITGMDYSVDTGPKSVFNVTVNGVLEIKTPEGQWIKVADFKVPANSYYKDFSVSFNTPKEATQIRLRALRHPVFGDCYIDGSKVTIYVKDSDGNGGNNGGNGGDDGTGGNSGGNGGNGNGGNGNGGNEENWWDKIPIDKIISAIVIIAVLFIIYKLAKK